MNRNLKPGILALIGIALVIFTPQVFGSPYGFIEGVIGDMLQIGGTLGGYLCILLAIIGGIKKITSMGSPASIVQMQKKTYLRMRENYPDRTKEDLWMDVFTTRPGFQSPAEIAKLLTFTSDLAIKQLKPTNFRNIVFAMIVIEYKQFNKKIGMTQKELYQYVSDQIPEDW